MVGVVNNQLILSYAITYERYVSYPHRVQELISYLRKQDINHVYEPTDQKCHLSIFLNAFDPECEKIFHQIRLKIISMIKEVYHEKSIELLYYDIGT